MRAIALHEDLLVFVSAVWQTTATAVRAGEEGFLIDSPVLPEELQPLPGVLEQAGFPVSGLLATHADWDHLLGRLAFPAAALGCGEATAERLAAEPGAAQRALRDFDQQWYVGDGRRLSLGTVQALPVPGRLELGAQREIEVVAAPGHTADGVAYLLPWLRVLVCGDYLSPVEIPMISRGGSRQAYEDTLERLRGELERVDTVIPGHGAPQPVAAARRLLEEDLAYLRALSEQRDGAPLPEGRRSHEQRRIHRENAERTGGG